MEGVLSVKESCHRGGGGPSVDGLGDLVGFRGARYLGIDKTLEAPLPVRQSPLGLR